MPPPPAPSPIAKLPRLTLLSDLPPDKRAALATKMSLETSQAQCVSVGPFDDPAIAGKAATVLLAKGFTPQQRAVQSPAMRRFWVYLEGFRSDATEMRALHRLEQAGIDDAEAMPVDAGGPPCLVGSLHGPRQGRGSPQARAKHRLQSWDERADAAGHGVQARLHAPECVDRRAVEGRFESGAGRRQLGHQRATLWVKPIAGGSVAGCTFAKEGITDYLSRDAACARFQSRSPCVLCGSRDSSTMQAWRGRTGALRRSQGRFAGVRALRALGPVQSAARNSHSARSSRRRLSSVVEQRFCKPLVGGSNPSAGTKITPGGSRAWASFSGSRGQKNRWSVGVLWDPHESKCRTSESDCSANFLALDFLSVSRF